MSFLHAFSIHFLVKMTKCMLQSKETNHFDTRCLTHVLGVVSSFRKKKKRMDLYVLCVCVKSNVLCSKFRKKWKEFETEDNNINSLQKKLKLM